MEKNKNVRAFWIVLFIMILLVALFSCAVGVTAQSYIINSRFDNILKEQYYRGMYDVCIQTDLTITQCKRLVRNIESNVNPYKKESIDWTWPIEDK